jgi:hypothetical protein
MRPKPRPIVLGELVWYWQQSAADMGFSSSWGPMVAAASGSFGGGGGKPDARITDARMSATARHRTIRKRLDQLQRAHLATLRAIYGGTICAPQVVAHFGQLAPIAPRTKAAGELYEAERAKGKTKLGSTEQWLALACSAKHEALDAVMAEALEMFGNALEAWKATKDG